MNTKLIFFNVPNEYEVPNCIQSLSPSLLTVLFDSLATIIESLPFKQHNDQHFNSNSEALCIERFETFKKQFLEQHDKIIERTVSEKVFEREQTLLFNISLLEKQLEEQKIQITISNEKNGGKKYMKSPNIVRGEI